MIVIQNPAGEDVEVFVAVTGAGHVDAIIRATNRATFEAAALSQNILQDVNGELVPAPGCDIDRIGEYCITPAVYEEDGETMISSAVWDTRYHVNLRIGQPALSNETDGFPNWKATAILWTENGTTDAQVNANESALVLSGVSLIDPDTVETQGRVWL